MKIAIVQTNPIIGDYGHNAAAIIAMADRARKLGCELVIFPELSIPGYPPRDLLEKREFVDANLACLDRLVGTIRGIGVICGVVEHNTSQEGKPLFNAAVLFENGRIIHRAHKRLLPTYDVFDESRYFECGQVSQAFNYKDLHLGLTICEDAWNDKDVFKKRIYHVDPVELLARDGMQLLINISASVYQLGKQAFRRSMLSAIARKYRVPLLFANQVGGNDSVLFDGTSSAFDVNGEMVCRARDFKEDLIVFDTQSGTDNGSQMHPVSTSAAESIYRALVMGTHDYVFKCGFEKVVVGLSGGIDSALTLCIAVSALGKRNVSSVFMPSEYTSRDNYDDTRQLAENLDIAYEIIPIDEMFAAFLKHLSPDVDLQAPGVTEQNIQARIRGTVLMALSNKTGSLVLSTGNKSELAMGYCTLYGDMSGGLAVISDVPKTMVYSLARFINADAEVIPRRIIVKPPSAELKPNQSDQDDLPPYDVLDPILKGYIENLKCPAELVRMGFDADIVKQVVAKVDRNEYKRHQAAPGLKVTSKAFGYGRRYPLAQRFRGQACQYSFKE